MVIEINTHPIQSTPTAQTANFQSSFRPTASTISSQAAGPGESKSILGHIIDFIKKIFCCCSSSTSTGGNAIARLIEQGKAVEAAAAWVAVIEKDSEIAENPVKALKGWLDAFDKAKLFEEDGKKEDVYAVVADFTKKYFAIDDPQWGEDHAEQLLDFAAALPEAFGKSSNSNIQSLENVRGLNDWMSHITKHKSE
jgi:hypothetical protein